MFGWPWWGPWVLLPPMGGAEAGPPHAPDLAREVAELRGAIRDLQATLAAAPGGPHPIVRPPAAGPVVVEHLDFNVGWIHINELSGEFNLGLTSRYELGAGRQRGGRGGRQRGRRGGPQPGRRGGRSGGQGA